jgi:hypothetical protein
VALFQGFGSRGICSLLVVITTLAGTSLYRLRWHHLYQLHVTRTWVRNGHSIEYVALTESLGPAGLLETVQMVTEEPYVLDAITIQQR